MRRYEASTFLLIEEVARELRASLPTVRNWIRLGKLTSYKIGKRRLIKKEDLEEFLNRSRKEAKPASNDGKKSTLIRSVERGV